MARPTKPTDLLGDLIADALTIEAEHAEQDAEFDGAALAHALYADRARWNEYVTLARNLKLRDAEAVVFVAAATPAPTKGRRAADPIRAAIFAAAEADGCGPHSRKHGAAVLTLPPRDPTDGLTYDVAAGADRHEAEISRPRTKAPGPAKGRVASDRTLREQAQKRRAARESGQGFFFGLGFRSPVDPDDDDLLPEGV